MSNKLGVDYSWARPGGAALQAAGYSFAARYLSNDTSGKNITASEAVDLHEHGIDIVLVWEDSATAALQGKARGITDATSALAMTRALSVPDSVTIYFAVDFDATEAQQTAIDDYLAGCASVIGLDRTGIYGGYWPVSRAAANKSASKFWQTSAWSGANIFAGAALLQKTTQVFNGGCDVDVEENVDLGAWVAGTPITPLSQPVVAVLPVAPSPIMSAGRGGTYTVVSGDTLSEIGLKTGSDWKAIASVNSIPVPYVIYPGQVLQLPGGGIVRPEPVNTSGRYTVQKGDTLSGIAASHNTTWQSLQRLNNIANPNEIAVGEVLVIPGAGTPAATYQTYTVVSGDTLSGIASKYGTTYTAIAQLNNIAKPYVIYPGEVLRIS